MGVWAFVIGLSQVSSFLSLKIAEKLSYFFCPIKRIKMLSVNTSTTKYDYKIFMVLYFIVVGYILSRMK